MEKREEEGFQHLEQPQAWLCRMGWVRARVTGDWEGGQWQVRVIGREGSSEVAEEGEGRVSRRGWREIVSVAPGAIVIAERNYFLRWVVDW